MIAIDTDANTPIVGPKVIIIRWRRMTKEDVILSLDRNVDLAIRRPREPFVVVQVESRISGAISGAVGSAKKFAGRSDGPGTSRLQSSRWPSWTSIDPGGTS